MRYVYLHFPTDEDVKNQIYVHKTAPYSSDLCILLVLKNQRPLAKGETACLHLNRENLGSGLSLDLYKDFSPKHPVSSKQHMKALR